MHHLLLLHAAGSCRYDDVLRHSVDLACLGCHFCPSVLNACEFLMGETRHPKHRRLGFFLYPLAKLADAISSCWSRLWTGSAQKDLERIQKEMEKDEFDQSMCPICLERLVQKNRFSVSSVLLFWSLVLWDLSFSF